MTTNEATPVKTEQPTKVDPNEGKKRINFMVDADLYDATFGDDLWDQRMKNSEYLEFILGERVKTIRAQKNLAK